MYSVVLMAALVTSNGAPNWHNRSNCYCPPVQTCSYYAGCSGCYGHSAPQGYGAAGGCYGYHGGCYGAFGHVYGVDNYQGGCYGCYGGHSGYGIPVPVWTNPTPTAPARDPFPAINPKRDDKGGAEEIAPLKEKQKEKKILEEQSKAKISIEVPEGAKLFVDGNLINVAPGTRTFQSPALAPGESYFYEVRLEISQNGQRRVEEQRVVVRSGQDALVRFQTLQLPGTDTAQVNK